MILSNRFCICHTKLRSVLKDSRESDPVFPEEPGVSNLISPILYLRT